MTVLNVWNLSTMRINGPNDSLTIHTNWPHVNSSACPCTREGKHYWKEIIKAHSVKGLMCYGIPRQMACWTRQTHFGMSDGGRKQDQARKEGVKKVVKWKGLNRHS